VAALLGACAAALWLPSSGAATSGSVASGGAGLPNSNTTSIRTAQLGNLMATSSANGMTISARASALLSSGLRVSGSLPTADAGQTVQVEFLGGKTGWTWQAAAQTTVQSNGSYTAVWVPSVVGKFAVRALLGQASGATVAASVPTISVTVYRASLATLFGPGLYGRSTACGTILRRWTLGVANRTLPCGTPVAIFYAGRTLTVPVIDRGPYAHGANWDLTMATGKALGMYQTETIGAAPFPPPP
jgi:rare lipoprotein A